MSHNTITLYRRLEFFFEANGITDESKKWASLITVIGPETHKYGGREGQPASAYVLNVWTGFRRKMYCRCGTGCDIMCDDSRADSETDVCEVHVCDE